MTGMEIRRSVAFVSLDTHPANNALVVSYEIQVSLCDQAGAQLFRRSKRDQCLVSLSALDALRLEHFSRSNPAVDLDQLSRQILSKCPLLAASDQSVEDIQLHLLYLVGRRQNQLLGQESPANDRPPSSASQRLQRIASASDRRHWRASSGAARRPASRESKARVVVGETDPYEMVLTKQHNFPWHSSQMEAHLAKLDSRLAQGGGSDGGPAGVDLSHHLDGLYGSLPEKLAALDCLRQMSRSESGLVELCSSRLLVCALIRTLRDSSPCDSASIDVRLSILLLLARFTYFVDTFAIAFGQPELIAQQRELIRALGDLLSGVDQSDQVLADPNYHTLNLTLIIFHNLFRHALIESSQKSRLLPDLVGQLVQLAVPASEPAQASSNTGCLLGLLEWSARSLLRDLQLRNKTNRSLTLVGRLLDLLRLLSVYREFVSSCAQEARSADILVGLLTALQLNQSANQKSSSLLAGELIQLELDLFALLANLMLDRRLKSQLLRKNLLKYVLRNLVVFLVQQRQLGRGPGQARDRSDCDLAARSLKRFGRSQVLLAPLKCLYELTRLCQVRLELLKSRIVIKCLLDYLQASCLLELDQLGANRMAELANERDSLRGVGQLQFELEAAGTTASEYILCIWINLSARHPMPEFEEGLLAECIRLSLDCLEKGSARVCYLQAKWLRNLALHSGRLDGRLEDLTKLAAESLNRRQYLLACESLWAISNQLSWPVDKPERSASAGELRLMNCLLETIDSGDLEQEDDLLLAGTVSLARLAACREICSARPALEAAASRLLEFSKTDRQLTGNWLRLLVSLMNHSRFLQGLLGMRPRVARDSFEQLADRLAELMLSAGDRPSSELGRLACAVMERLVQLNRNESAELRAEERRFAAYNAKWLGAIRGSQEAGCVAPLPAEGWPEDTRLELFVRSESGATSDELEPASEGASLDGLSDEGDADSQQGALDDEYLEAPDAGVIDAESMVAHLASAR